MEQKSDLRRDHYMQYMDADNLISNDLKPTTLRTGGNQLLETWTAWIVMAKLGVLLPQDMVNIIQVTNRCQVPGKPGIYDRSPPLADGSRAMDPIAHDDLIGISMGSSFFSLGFDNDIMAYGRLSGWRLSNTGDWYYTASVKPWHRAAYILAAWEKPGDELPDDFSILLLAGAILWDSIGAKDGYSGRRLVWLMVTGLAGKNKLIDLASRVWKWRLKARYGSMRTVFAKYYQNDQHPNALYAPDEE